MQASLTPSPIRTSCYRTALRKPKLSLTVNFPAVAPFPACLAQAAQAGVRQPKPWAWGSAEPWELAGLAEGNGLASPGYTRVPRDRLLSCDLWLAACSFPFQFTQVRELGLTLTVKSWACSSGTRGFLGPGSPGSGKTQRNTCVLAERRPGLNRGFVSGRLLCSPCL